jgi:hypothetical protein
MFQAALSVYAREPRDARRPPRAAASIMRDLAGRLGYRVRGPRGAAGQGRYRRVAAVRGSTQRADRNKLGARGSSTGHEDAGAEERPAVRSPLAQGAGGSPGASARTAAAAQKPVGAATGFHLAEDRFDDALAAQVELLAPVGRQDAAGEVVSPEPLTSGCRSRAVPGSRRSSSSRRRPTPQRAFRRRPRARVRRLRSRPSAAGWRCLATRY